MTFAPFGRLLPLAAALIFTLAAPGLAAAAAPGESKGIFDLPDRWDLSIYTLVVFLLLLFILSKFAWPNIQSGLLARERTIASAQEAAVLAKQEAEDLRVKLAAEFASANDKIRMMLEEARRDADALRAVEREAGVKEAAAERDRAKQEITAAKNAALQEIYQQSVQLASLMSSKALRRNLSADDHARLVDESLAELKAGAGRN